MKNAKAVLITGVAGFLGSNLAEFYLRQGRTVVGVDNFCSGLRENIDDLKEIAARNNVTFLFFEADVIQSWSFMDKIDGALLEQVQLIFHLASPASPATYQSLPLETWQANTQGLLQALQLAEKNKARVIFASTSEIYGDPLVHPQPETYWGNVNSYGPRSCYDESKRAGEALIYMFNQKNPRHGLVRIFNTYGPRMNPRDGRVIVNMLLQALRKEPLTIYGEGLQTRSFCYVDDLVEGLALYAASDLTEPLNLGNPDEVSILELVDLIEPVFPNLKITKKFLPLPKEDPQQRQPDISKAKQTLGWQPKISLPEGLRKTGAWLQRFIK